MTLREALRKKGFTAKDIMGMIRRNAKSLKTPPHCVSEPTCTDCLQVERRGGKEHLG